MMHCCRVEKTMDKVDDACKFTSRLLKQGNTVEIVSLGNIVITQLHKILSTSPEPEVNTSIEFVTDGTKFQAAVKVWLITVPFAFGITEVFKLHMDTYLFCRLPLEL